MGDNSRYWEEKEKHAEQAKKHYNKMKEKYGKEIYDCAMASRVYGENALPLANVKKTGAQGKITVMLGTTTDALAACDPNEQVALLNFASYKNPGGMYMKGSVAQEEYLCHASTLYNVLEQFHGYYEWNVEHLNRGMYRNRAIYSPDVMFTNCGRKADVITCAAPNKSVLIQYGRFTEAENRKALEERIDFVRDICLTENVKTIILGAWGCGVFSQDAGAVAGLFDRAFKNTGINCIYAIPDQKTYNVFKVHFGPC